MDRINSYAGNYNDYNANEERTKSRGTYNNVNYLTNNQGQIVGFKYEGKKILFPKNNETTYTKEDVNEIIDSYISIRQSSTKSKSSAPKLDATKFHSKLKELQATSTDLPKLNNEIKAVTRKFNNLVREGKKIRNNKSINKARALADNTKDLNATNKKLILLQNKKNNIEHAYYESQSTRERRTPGSNVNFKNISQGITLRPGKVQSKKILRNLMNRDRLQNIKEENNFDEGLENIDSDEEFEMIDMPNDEFEDEFEMIDMPDDDFEDEFEMIDMPNDEFKMVEKDNLKELKSEKESDSKSDKSSDFEKLDLSDDDIDSKKW